MGWVSLTDIVREDLADNVNLEVGGGIRLNNRKYIFSKSADGSTDAILIGMNDVNNTLVGYGTYEHSLGGSYVYGNDSVGIRSKGSFTITAPSAGLSNRAYGVNKILASTASYMNSSQTITLSEAVSAQPNGIILVWSYYSGGAANYEWTYNFVPKHHVSSHNGTGMYNMVASGGTTKYIYVYDTKIVGYGSQAGSNVLRYVIGV